MLVKPAGGMRSGRRVLLATSASLVIGLVSGECTETPPSMIEFSCAQTSCMQQLIACSQAKDPSCPILEVRSAATARGIGDSLVQVVATDVGLNALKCLYSNCMVDLPESVYAGPSAVEQDNDICGIPFYRPAFEAMLWPGGMLDSPDGFTYPEGFALVPSTGAPVSVGETGAPSVSPSTPTARPSGVPTPPTASPSLAPSAMLTSNDLETATTDGDVSTSPNASRQFAPVVIGILFLCLMSVAILRPPPKSTQSDVFVIKVATVFIGVAIVMFIVLVAVSLASNQKAAGDGAAAKALAACAVGDGLHNISLPSGMTDSEMNCMAIHFAEIVFAKDSSGGYAEFEAYDAWFQKTLLSEDCMWSNNDPEAPESCVGCARTEEKHRMITNVRTRGSDLYTVKTRIIDAHNIELTVRAGVPNLGERYIFTTFAVESGKVVSLNTCTLGINEALTNCINHNAAGCIREDLRPNDDSILAYNKLVNSSTVSKMCKSASSGEVITDPTPNGGAMSENFCLEKADLDEFNTVVELITVLVGFGGFCLLFWTGTILDTDLIVLTIKKPKAIAAALFGQSVLNPLILYALTASFDFNDYILVMAVALSASPGGGTSNALVYLARGTVTISAALTLCGMLTAAFTMPFWTWFLTSMMGRGIDVDIPVLTLLQPIIAVSCSVCLGLLFRMWLGDPRSFGLQPGLGSRAATSKLVSEACKIVGFPLALFAIFLYFSSVVSISAVRLVDGPLLLVGLLVQCAGLAIGWASSVAFRLEPIYHRTIALEVGAQNILLAVGATTLTFIDNPAHLAEALPYFLAYIMMSPVNFLFTFVMRRFPTKTAGDKELVKQMQAASSRVADSSAG